MPRPVETETPRHPIPGIKAANTGAQDLSAHISSLSRLGMDADLGENVTAEAMHRMLHLSEEEVGQLIQEQVLEPQELVSQTTAILTPIISAAYPELSPEAVRLESLAFTLSLLDEENLTSPALTVYGENIWKNVAEPLFNSRTPERLLANYAFSLASSVLAEEFYDHMRGTKKKTNFLPQIYPGFKPGWKYSATEEDRQNAQKTLEEINRDRRNKGKRAMPHINDAVTALTHEEFEMGSLDPLAHDWVVKKIREAFRRGWHEEEGQSESKNESYHLNDLFRDFFKVDVQDERQVQSFVQELLIQRLDNKWQAHIPFTKDMPHYHFMVSATKKINSLLALSLQGVISRQEIGTEKSSSLKEEFIQNFCSWFIGKTEAARKIWLRKPAAEISQPLLRRMSARHFLLGDFVPLNRARLGNVVESIEKLVVLRELGLNVDQELNEQMGFFSQTVSGLNQPVTIWDGEGWHEATLLEYLLNPYLLLDTEMSSALNQMEHGLNEASITTRTHSMNQAIINLGVKLASSEPVYLSASKSARAL